MILTIVSIVVNVIFILLFVLFVIKPEIFNSTIDTQFKARYNALQKHYQDQENKLQRDLAAKTRQVTDEIFALRRKLESDINIELEESRRMRHIEINRSLEDRLDAMREKERMAEEEIMRQFEMFKLQYDIEKEAIEQKLQSLKSYEASAIAARVRMYEEANKEKFYTLQLEDSDVEEIDELVEVLPKLRNPLPLRKAIFDIYYRQAVRDLVNRVVGQQDRPTGIYKITLLETGECYVGQSVDIGSRWLQHIKKGFGVDDGGTSKLHQAMMKYGLQSFKFEVVEFTSEDLLNEKEKYWADYFKAKEFGFSIKN